MTGPGERGRCRALERNRLELGERKRLVARAIAPVDERALQRFGNLAAIRWVERIERVIEPWVLQPNTEPVERDRLAFVGRKVVRAGQERYHVRHFNGEGLHRRAAVIVVDRDRDRGVPCRRTYGCRQ